MNIAHILRKNIPFDGRTTFYPLSRGRVKCNQILGAISKTKIASFRQERINMLLKNSGQRKTEKDLKSIDVNVLFADNSCPHCHELTNIYRWGLNFCQNCREPFLAHEEILEINLYGNVNCWHCGTEGNVTSFGVRKVKKTEFSCEVCGRIIKAKRG